jgi:hypothetical protein
MAEPTTPNISLISPNTGDLPGAWATAAVNLNNLAIDGLLGGTQTITLSSATTFALTVATGAITPGAGPFQSQNACLFFSGTLTGNAVVQFTAPGRYVVHNKCTVGAFYVQLAPSAGTGNVVAAPPGQKVTVFYDGTSMDYVDTLPVGAEFNLHGATAVPAWIGACTIAPYLLRDGSVYSSSIYPALGTLLGSTYGGNGITTFGVPDSRNRIDVPIDTNTNGGFTNRITTASGINGQVLNAAGGAQLLARNSLPIFTLSIPAGQGSHTHTTTNGGDILTDKAGSGGILQGSSPTNLGSPLGSATLPAMVTENLNNTGTQTGSLPPTIVSVLALIKT